MFPVSDFRDCLERANRLLTGCRVRYYLTGGAAAIAYGDPRTTQDVDLVVEAATLRNCLPEFLAALKHEQFLFNEATIRDAVRSGRQFQLIEIDSTFKLDLYPRELSPGGFDRAVPMEIVPGLLLPVASRVDLAVSKLVWIDKGSHRSRRDLRWILRRATAADREQIDRFAAQLKLTKLLAEVLAEPDEIDA